MTQTFALTRSPLSGVTTKRGFPHSWQSSGWTGPLQYPADKFVGMGDDVPLGEPEDCEPGVAIELVLDEIATLLLGAGMPVRAIYFNDRPAFGEIEVRLNNTKAGISLDEGYLGLRKREAHTALK